MEPAPGNISVYEQGGKYGLIFKDNSKSGPIYDTILGVGRDLAILKKGERIGVINSLGKAVALFSFTDAVIEASWAPAIRIAYALKKRGLWYYFDSGTKLFHSKYQPVSVHIKFAIVKSNGGFNYIGPSGKLLLSSTFKWLSPSGFLGINNKNEIVLLDSLRREYKYYTP